MNQPAPLATWHRLLEEGDPGGLSDLLADDATFHSPVLFEPQQGKALTQMYLTAAFHVLVPNGFRYVREVVDGNNAVLEFVADVEGIHVNGVDMIRWNADGQIEDFKVMIRPWKALEALRANMQAMLASVGPS